LCGRNNVEVDDEGERTGWSAKKGCKLGGSGASH